MTENDKMSRTALPNVDAAPAPAGGKQEAVVRAATRVFLRYGFARTTMGDIAAEAGISRPAVYLLFAGKDAVFAAVVALMDAEWHAEVRAAFGGLPTMPERLRFACERWGLHGYEVIARHPDARDLFDLKSPAVREMYDHFQALLSELIAPAVAASPLAASAPELARVLAFGLRGLRETVVSAADTRRLVSLQVSLLLAALGATPGGG